MQHWNHGAMEWGPLVGSAGSLLCLGLALLAGAAPARADDRDVRVTVYNNNLGLINETRSLRLSDGLSQVEVTDVAALIDPTTVHLRPTRGDAEVIEQNFQYDLANPDRILNRYLDERVDVVLKQGDVKSGSLLSYDGGSLVLRGEAGGLDLVSRTEAVDVRFPSLPSGLRTRPTLVWQIESSAGGATPVELSYSTEGMNWHAEYVAVSNEKDDRIDLSAWVSIENNCGATFPNAALQLVAGDVQRIQPPMPQYARRDAQVLAMNGAMEKGFEEEAFFEYHLYTLDRRTTLADRETKQISLFPSTQSPVKKIYEYNAERDQKKVFVALETENKTELGLGMPLPAGKVRTFKKDSAGRLQFIGEDQIQHTPKNEKIRLGLGNAFDVVAERTELDSRRISDRVFEQDIQIKLRNRKTEAIQVVVLEHFWGDWTIVKSSSPSTKKDARTAEFRIDVGADQEVELTLTVRNRS